MNIRLKRDLKEFFNPMTNYDIPLENFPSTYRVSAEIEQEFERGNRGFIKNARGLIRTNPKKFGKLLALVNEENPLKMLDAHGNITEDKTWVYNTGVNQVRIRDELNGNPTILWVCNPGDVRLFTDTPTIYPIGNISGTRLKEGMEIEIVSPREVTGREAYSSLKKFIEDLCKFETKEMEFFGGAFEPLKDQVRSIYDKMQRRIDERFGK